MDLYTFGTPNGQKIPILLEELGIPYNVKKIDISKGEQNTPEFRKINPNGKIPALVDGDTTVFESVAILIYLAEKYKKFLPEHGPARYETLQWCLFQAAGVGPMLGQFGHFKVFAKEKIPYAIERYQNEVLRLFGVLEEQLSKNQYLAGDQYSIADMTTYPWLLGYTLFYKEKIDAEKFPSINRWMAEIGARPAVQKGLRAAK
jgi:GSH-dependent disulfide-bond oxidoreductase